MIYIGVDPGLSGAIAIIGDDIDPQVFDMPIMQAGGSAGRNEVNAVALFNILRLHSSQKSHAVLEKVHSMPGMSPSSMFSFGDSFGVARSCLACANLSVSMVTPVAWKKHFGIEKDKEISRALAIRMYPNVNLSKKKDADKAEALLIASYAKAKKLGLE